MAEYDIAGVAQAAGVEPAYVARLVELGILAPAEGGTFSAGDARRAALVSTLEHAGLPLAGIGAAVRQGQLSLGFADQPAYESFAAVQAIRYRELSTETGVPLEILLLVREAMGFAPAVPDDRVRSDELDVVPLLQLLVEHGVRAPVIERLLRTAGDSMRRVADTVGDLWRTDVVEPLLETGHQTAEVGDLTARLAAEFAVHEDRALLGLFHGQQKNAWVKNIFEWFERTLVEAGLHAAGGIPPAICFLDITGYTRLTEERGDAAAADLAARLARLVQRTSVGRGGKPVKWLGDGVMFHFREPGPGVIAALEMVEGAREIDLPPAHVGLHAGPVLFQDGDYFGRTVNAAARIAEYARQGEVLVSQDVVDAVDMPGVAFSEIGPVELKGLSGTLRLYAARRAP